MGCFDFFRFDNDFKFKNHKGDIVIIEKDIEFQTKDLKAAMYRLIINENNEIESPVYETIINKELPFEHPLKYNSRISHYEKINFTGIINIYHYDLENSNNDKIFDLWVEDGKIYKIEQC